MKKKKKICIPLPPTFVSPATDATADASVVEAVDRFLPNTARINISCTSSCRTK